MALLLCTILWVPAHAAERVALVIGNSAYQHTTRLNNPHNDARAVAAALERMGFAVTRVDEADKSRLTRELTGFRARSRNAELALLYYAGHAIQVEGRNYLVPVDAKVEELGDLGLNLLRLNDALQQLQGQVNVVILDACRDNPFAEQLNRSAARLGRSLGATRGLVREETLLGGGTYLMLAAAPEAVAQDGPPGGHSPYTAALLEYLETPELDLRFLHARVREAVEARTHGVQTPEAIDRLPSRPIYLAGVAVEAAPVAPTSGVDPRALELAFWQSMQNSRNAADFEAYLEQYPRGSFAALARNRLAALRAVATPPPQVPVTSAPPATPADSPPTLSRFRVEVTPANARVRIMNITPAYRADMELEPGRYDIEVSAPGHQTHRSWYQLSAGPQVLRLTLTPQAPATVAAPAVTAPAAGLIEGRYQVRGSRGEIIHDTTTGLEWQRCSLGQTWDGRTCTGEASGYTWRKARAAADRVSGWRLPSKDELRTLVYCSSGQPARFKKSDSGCSGNYQKPTIVAEAFPSTPSLGFWSGSPSADHSSYAWGVAFFNGLAGVYGHGGIRTSFNRVRLVRGGQ